MSRRKLSRRYCSAGIRVCGAPALSRGEREPLTAGIRAPAMRPSPPPKPPFARGGTARGESSCATVRPPRPLAINLSHPRACDATITPPNPPFARGGTARGENSCATVRPPRALAINLCHPRACEAAIIPPAPLLIVLVVRVAQVMPEFWAGKTYKILPKTKSRRILIAARSDRCR
jgi:hypothetical protein